MEEIDKLCKMYNIKNYTINEDGSIDVDGNVDLINKGLTKLPLKFNKVNGSFHCNGNNLTTLKGSPKYVGIDFYCYENSLSSLKHSPEYVGGLFSCTSNIITSLVYSPKKVMDVFYCHDNKLNNLCGIGEVDYIFSDILIGDMNDINEHILEIKLKRLINEYK